MKIKYINGDLFRFNDRIVLHGCNAAGGFGSGFAGQIKRHYPHARQKYLDYHKENGLKLGETIWVVDGDRIIVHGITQEFYGYDRKKYVDYDAVRMVMNKVNQMMPRVHEEFDAPLEVAMPKIGSDLAGGKWEIIEAIIEEESTNFQPIVYYI